MPNLIYIADPMCSWCYAFGPELLALLEGLPGLPVEVIVGGLRAHNTTVMDEATKAELMVHWKKVHEASGLPLIDLALERPGFIYDTEPSCRAVVAARNLAPTATLAVFHAIQHAFYGEGRDITRGDVLAEVCSGALSAAGVPTNAADFHALWNSEKIVLATHADFVQTQSWKITGFPCLVLERNGQLDMVTSGFTRVPVLVEQLQSLVDHSSQT